MIFAFASLSTKSVLESLGIRYDSRAQFLLVDPYRFIWNLLYNIYSIGVLRFSGISDWSPPWFANSTITFSWRSRSCLYGCAIFWSVLGVFCPSGLINCIFVVYYYYIYIDNYELSRGEFNFICLDLHRILIKFFYFMRSRHCLFFVGGKFSLWHTDPPLYGRERKILVSFL